MKQREICAVELRHCAVCDSDKLEDEFPLSTSSDSAPEICLSCGSDRLTGEEERPYRRTVLTRAGCWDSPQERIVARQELKQQQGRCCAICGIAEEESGKSLHLDHDHETQMIRALLCFRCNHLLGCALDSPAILKAAAGYLERFGHGL